MTGPNGPRPVEHSLKTTDPGRIAIDLWGWEGTPFYQRSDPPVITPEYMKTRAIDESYKWGANILEIYRGGFPLEEREGWTKESTLGVNRHAHARGMIIHWFPHRMGIPSTEEAIESVLSLGREQVDCLRQPAEELLDGIGTEQWSCMLPLLFNMCFWPYNPAAYFYTDNHLFSDTLPNEQDVSASNGGGSDDQTTGYYQLFERIEKRGGLQFWGSQIECRTGGVAGNNFGRMGYPDWVMKQANDQFRCRLRTRGENLSPSAMWWINEAESVCPDANRLYVYGVSQDPVRCAVSALLTATGQGGYVQAGGRTFKDRYPFPAETGFIQNNYLRLYHRHDRDGAVLVRDPERTAHYDNNSFAETLLGDFVSTVRLDGAALPAPGLTLSHPEPAGHKAVLQARLTHAFDRGSCREVRTFTMVSDTPWVRVHVYRKGGPGVPELATCVGTGGYDTLIAGTHTYTEAAAFAPPPLLRLTDSSGALPELFLAFTGGGPFEEVRWTPNEGLVLVPVTQAETGVEFCVALPEGLYTEDELPSLATHLARGDEPAALDGNGQLDVSNDLPIPVVKLLRIAGADEHPYQVFEYGCWSFRGAQPSQVHQGEDYLKVYLAAGGTAQVQRNGFVEGLARPGRGCQYTMALRSAKEQQGVCAVDVEVRDVTSFLYAPRLQFAFPVASVKVNGEDWHYFDGDQVMLPNHRGAYRVEATRGELCTPHLARTFASIEATKVAGDRLTFEAALPEWSDSIPEEFYFKAFVRHPGRFLVDTQHAHVVRNVRGEGSIIRFKPGKVFLAFGPNAPQDALSRVDREDVIPPYLARQDARHMAQRLAGFHIEQVPLIDAARRNIDLHDFDVLCWYRYYLDALPPEANDDLFDALHEFVADGGGLFLGHTALRALPGITGLPATEFERRIVMSRRIEHRLYEFYRTIAVRPEIDAAEHPIFRGLSPRSGGSFEFSGTGGFVRFHRLMFDLPPSETSGRPLASLELDPVPESDRDYELPDEPAAAPTPVLWEWAVEDGKVLGCSINLRTCYGSVDRSGPNPNELQFMRNAIRYLGGLTGGPRVGLLW